MAMDVLTGLLLEIKKIESIEALLHWDQETYMPEGSGGIRADHISFLSSLAHKLHTSDTFANELTTLVNMETGATLDQKADKGTQRMLYLVWKNYRDASVLPESLVAEKKPIRLSSTYTQASVILSVAEPCSA